MGYAEVDFCIPFQNLTKSLQNDKSLIKFMSCNKYVTST